METPSEPSEGKSWEAMPSLVEKSDSSDPVSATIHRLSNGLTVYISENHDLPEIRTHIAVRAGGFDDPAASTGLAHYLEHMLFKGSKSLGTTDYQKEKHHIEKIRQLYLELKDVTNSKVLSAAEKSSKRKSLFEAIDSETQLAAKYAIPNELDQLYASLGITGVNAFTSQHVTSYITAVPPSSFEAWAKVEADRFMNPVFRLFYPELESVYEEKNRSLDSPGSRQYQKLMSLLYSGHPYGDKSVIGTSEHLKTPAYGDMEAYFKRYYRPENTAIVLAGDIAPSVALPILEKNFSSWKVATVPNLPAAPAAIRKTGRAMATLKAKGQNAVSIAWALPPSKSPAAEKLYLAERLLGSKAGVLKKKLTISGLVADAGSYYVSYNEGGMLVVWADVKKDQAHEDVERLLREAVEDVSQGAFEDADLQAVVNRLDIQKKESLEDNRGRASAMLDAWVRREPWTYASKANVRMREVSKEQVIAVAKKYLSVDSAVVYMKDGEFSPKKIEKPKITPVALRQGVMSSFAKDAKAMKKNLGTAAKFLEKDEDYEYSNSTTGEFIRATNHKNDLFSLTFAYGRENPRDWTCFALDSLASFGGGGLPATATQSKLHQLGATVSHSCSADDYSVTVEGAAGNFESIMAVVRSVFESPTVDEAALRKKIEAEGNARNLARQNPRTLHSALIEYVLKGKRSRFVSVIPMSHLRGGNAVAEVTKALARLPKLKRRTLFFGPRHVAAVASFGSPSIAASKRHAVRLTPLTKDAYHHVNVKTSQTQIWMATPIGASSPEQMAMRRLLQEYLSGGMGAFLFQEVREARGMAYSVWGRFFHARRVGDDSSFVLSVGTQTDKSADVLKLLAELLGNQKMQKGRFELAKKSLLTVETERRIPPRTVAGYVNRFTDRGKSFDERQEWLSELNQISFEAFEKFSQTIFAQPKHIIVTGNTDNIPEPLKSKLSPTDPSSLFETD